MRSFNTVVPLWTHSMWQRMTLIMTTVYCVIEYWDNIYVWSRTIAFMFVELIFLFVQKSIMMTGWKNLPQNICDD